MTKSNSFWNEAGKAGLILGGISILYMLITHFTGTLGSTGVGKAMLISVLNTLLWIGKFLACIFCFKLLLRKYSACNPEADNSDVFKFGVAVAFLSALLYSAFYLAYTLFINPDVYEDAFNMISENYSSMLDSNSITAIESMKTKMPQIGFFSNLIYCTLFGTVLSAILSRNIPSRTPFDKINQEQ